MKTYNSAEAIERAQELFESAEMKTYIKAEKTYIKAEKACISLVPGAVKIPNESRAFNLLASDRKEVYCIVLTRKEVWVYDGETCPGPDDIEIIWRYKKED